MSRVYELVKDYLDNCGIPHRDDAEKQSCQLSLSVGTGCHRVIVTVGRGGDVVQVLGIAPFVPAKRRRRVGEALLRANFGLPMGGFEMDVDNGELRFRIATIVLEDEPLSPLMERLLVVTLAALDRYVPAILSLIHFKESPRDAIHHAEGVCSTNPQEKAG